MSDFLREKKFLRKLQKMVSSERRRTTRITPAKILRTRVWLESLFIDYGLSRYDFEEIFYDEGREETKTVIRWLIGLQTAKESTVMSLKGLHNSNLDIFSNPVFELLEKDIKRKTVNELLNRFVTKGELFEKTWDFSSLARWQYKYKFDILGHEDSDLLFQVGGIQGFIGIMILLRKAELDGDSYRHYLILKDAYRAFPGFCRDKYFKKRWRDFLALLMDVQGNIFTSSLLLKPRIDIIRKQIFAKNHPTMRADWEYSTESMRFVEPEHPYDLAELPYRDIDRDARPKIGRSIFISRIR